MNSNLQNKWTKTYYVYNDEILALINLWKEAPLNKKRKIQAQILDRMSYMVNKRVSSYKNSNMYEDLLQEGRMGIMLAMEKFDTTRSINFFQYSTWHIQNKIRIYLKKEKRRKREILVEHTPDSIDENVDPSIIVENEEQRRVLLAALNKLPKIDREVLKMRFGFNDGEWHTYQQIGDMFSLSKQRIEQITSRAVFKLRKNAQLRDFFDKYGVGDV